MKGITCRFVTLTLRGSNATLSKTLTHLFGSFVRLRDQKIWKENVDGGAYFVEIKRGANSGFWHAHLHAIVHGRYLPQDRLSDAWSIASSGSKIVDIRAVDDNDRAASYVAKYATKSFDRSVLADADSLMECMLSLRGRRMFSPLGDWRGNNLDEPEEPPVEWKRVGRLDVIVTLALGREPWAMAVLRSLRVEPAGSHDEPFFREFSGDRQDKG